MVWALVAVATVALAYRALLAERQTVDDLFIFLRYARNLAERGEFAFNAGERVEGTSSVVWTLALALVWKLGLRGAGMAKAMSFGCALLVPTTCAVVVRRQSPRQALAIALPAIALALDADFATWAASGMDTALFALACSVCVAFAAGGGRVAAFSLGCLSWVRPEGVLFAAFGVWALAAGGRHRARDLVVAAAAPVVGLTLVRLAYFHDVVPNTFWAKMSAGLNAADGKDYTGLGYIASALERRPLLLLLLPLACVRLRRLEPPPVRVALALLGASVAFALLAGGDWMYGRRLLVVALPLAGVVGAAVVSDARARAAPIAVCAALAAEAALTFDHAIDQRWREVEWLDQRLAHTGPAALAAVRPFVTPYPLDWMPAHLASQVAPYVAPGDVVAHVDVGELPYAMRDVAFLDGFGLVDRTAGRLAFFRHAGGLRAAARDAFFARRPSVAIVVLDHDGGRALSPAQAAAMEDPRFAAGWRELGRVPTWGGHPCVTFVRRDVEPAPLAVGDARAAAWLATVPDVVAPF
jgi:hypothetical protein